MNKKDKITELNKRLFNKMVEKFNTTYDDVLEEMPTNAEGLKDLSAGGFFDKYKWDNELEYNEFKKWAVDEISKTLKKSKKFAEGEFDWWDLDFGLSIKKS